MRPTSRTIPLSTGLNYHVLEWARSDAATHTVVLVHGFLDFSWSWKRVVDAWFEHHPALAETLHIVAPDMRGHGDSDRVGAGGYYHFMDYVADLRALLVQLRRERVSLVGHSMGGSICSYYTGAYPRGIRHLALLEGLSPPVEDPNVPGRIRAWISSWERARTRTSTGALSLEAAADRLMRHDPLLSKDYALELAEYGTRRGDDGALHFKHDLVHMTRGPYPFRIEFAEACWREITCPVLYVEGSESTFRHPAEETARRLSVFAGETATASIAGAAHMMQRHQPRALADILARFIGSPFAS